MPLPTPSLDDRTFQDIVDEAKRLIPLYCPEWTNHNVSDPGVALIELFAWMSEMVLYRVNQVPDRLYSHFLNLVGIEPFAPSVARTDLTFWLSTALDVPIVVPAATEVSTLAAGEADTVVFSTLQDLSIAPPRLDAAMTVSDGGRSVVDVWDDVRFDPAGVRCFASPDLSPGDTFCLGFRDSLAGVVLRLDIDAEAEGIGVDPTKPPLAWEIWNGDGWIGCQVFEDTTGGLNRAGAISLLVPVEHAPNAVGNLAAYWLRARLLAPSAGEPTYRASPRVRAVSAAAMGGTVTAEHAERFPAEQLGRSDGSPGQAFAAGHAPVLPRRADEVVEVVDGDESARWTEVPDFSSSGPEDRHVVWDDSTGTVRFGPRIRYPDGSIRQHGAIPRDGTWIRLSGYRSGGGRAANVGVRTLTVMRSSVPYVSGVVNLAPARGGVDAESVAEAKERAPLTLRTGQRAVTADDYERLTLESSIEVARARCQSAQRGNGAVQLLIVPRVRGEVTQHTLDDYALTPTLTETVSRHLDRHRIVGTAVEIGTPYYQGVSVVALVHGEPGRPPALVQQRAVEAISRFVNPLVGGTDGTGWPFDSDLNGAALTQLLESVEGIARVEETLLYEYDLRTGRRLGAAKEVIRLDRRSLFLAAAPQVIVR
ncbi:putative baseplate assembly protein [Nocardioides sp. LHD-245]|uniref:putative baseplate assembly protein n=1 Tax=Nocardioides sp. LHD-245 TaxID=3051387 RepID=UPI0027DF7184|nr:putative baseplate assembly protein [Nocardioides sp. LHD-245]